MSICAMDEIAFDCIVKVLTIPFYILVIIGIIGWITHFVRQNKKIEKLEEELEELKKGDVHKSVSENKEDKTIA